VDTRDGPGRRLQYGDELLLRYLDNDGSIQAAMPMRVVLDEPDVNFEAQRIRHGCRIDTVDWHLDLWIAPDLQPRWKDEDEAEAALGTDHLRAEDLKTARATGQAIIDGIQEWPERICDWRSFRPDPAWKTPALPDSWAALA